MSVNRPTSADLLEAVGEFLEKKILPKLDSYTSFHTRVAINALGIVKREIELGPGLDSGEHERLAAFLKQEGLLEELNAALCRSIRTGNLDFDTEEIIEHMKKTTMGRLSIDNPDYSTYKKWREKS